MSINAYIQLIAMVLICACTPCVYGMKSKIGNRERERLNALLLQFGVHTRKDASTPDSNGKTPLHHVLNHEDAEDLVKLLLELGADIDARDKQGKTSFLTAIEKRLFEIAFVLLRYEADANIPDVDNNSPLLIATKQDNYKVCKKLMHFGCNPNAHNNAQETPLKVAIKKNNRHIILKLLCMGANVSRRQIKQLNQISPVYEQFFNAKNKGELIVIEIDKNIATTYFCFIATAANIEELKNAYTYALQEKRLQKIKDLTMNKNPLEILSNFIHNLFKKLHIQIKKDDVMWFDEETYKRAIFESLIYYPPHVLEKYFEQDWYDEKIIKDAFFYHENVTFFLSFPKACARILKYMYTQQMKKKLQKMPATDIRFYFK